MAYIQVTFNDYMPKIWNTLKTYLNNNEIGVAALMGNMYAESGCTPYACQPSLPYNVCMTYIAGVDSGTITEWQFVHRGTSSTGGVANGAGGFGLCQWTYYSRKQNMYTYWNHGDTIGDLVMQLGFVNWEFNNTHTSTRDALKNATDLRTASDFVLFNYEGPADKSAEVQDTRYNYALQIYNQYAGTTPVEPPTPQPSPVDPPEPEPQPPIVASSLLEKHLPIWMYPSLRR